MDYYDKDTLPITFEGFKKLRRDNDYIRVGRDVLDNGKVVSTVWLGTDLNYSGEGGPLIFESRIFPSENSFSDLACRRYSTLKEAIEGHKYLVSVWGEA